MPETMKSSIEQARRQMGRTAELASAAREARQKFDLYEASTSGPSLTSYSRLRELEQARDLAESRLRRAQATLGPEDGETETTEVAAAEEPSLEQAAEDLFGPGDGERS
jgi:hypothetical protein